MDSKDLTSFHLFPKLPLEIQLMIWEHTWPPSQVIEATYYEDLDAEEFTEVTMLRLGGCLTTFLKTGFGSRALEEKPLEKCESGPVALWVCSLSRQHTLKEYTALRHEKYDAGSFFFSPQHDFIWLSQDFTDEVENMDDILQYYDVSHLSQIRNFLTQEIDWDDITSTDYTSKFLSPFGKIQNLFVLYMYVQVNGKWVVPSAKDLLSLFDRYRSAYTRFAAWEDHGSGIAKQIQFITWQAKSIYTFRA